MTIRVGVIGLNHGLQVHLPAYKASPSYEVVAVCARSAERAKAAALEHHIPGWYADARQLITSDEVDLVSIASPPYTHSGFTAAALASGKHVVTEIAFVCSTLDARVLLEMSHEMGRVGAPAYVLRYTPILRLVTDLLAQNRIGRPRLMRFETFSSFLARAGQGPRWIWDMENGGGILANYTSHALDLARRWFGPVKEVDGTLATFADVSAPDGRGPLAPQSPSDPHWPALARAGPGRTAGLADDTGFVTLHFESGMLAAFSHSAVTAYPRTSIELHGSEGSLLIEGFGDEATLLPMGGGEAQPLFPPEQYLEETRGHRGLLGAFDVFLDRLAAAITNDATPPHVPRDLPTIADGLEVTRLVDAARLASRQRRRIRLDEIR
jgi:predicted dehydrogenase